MAASLDDTSVVYIELYSWNINRLYPLHLFQYKRKVLLDFSDIKGPDKTHSTLQDKEGTFCKEGEGSCGRMGKEFCIFNHRKGNIFLSQHCNKNSYTKPSNRGFLQIGEFACSFP